MFHRLLPLLVIAAVGTVPREAQAIELANFIREANHWGIGFGGGNGPSGLSFKYFLGDDMAIQVVAGGYGWGENGWTDNDDFGGAGLGVQADFLFELPTIVMAGDVMELGWSIGPGVWFGAGPDFWLGVSGTLGLEFNFIPAPIDLVLEYKPSFKFVDTLGFNPISFAGHVRVYFM